MSKTPTSRVWAAVRGVCIAAACAQIVSGTAVAQSTPSNSAPAQDAPKTPPQAIGPGAQPRPTTPAPSSTEPETPTGVFDEHVDGKAAVEKLKAAAFNTNTRVLIVWGTNAGERGGRLKLAMETNDIERMLDMEYQAIWLNVGAGPNAEANRALAATMKAKISDEAGELPSMTVLDCTGEVLGHQGGKKLLDPARSKSRPTFSVIAIHDFLHLHMVDRVKVEDEVHAATKNAAASGKGLLVWFSEHRERWSDKFEQLLARSEVKAAIEPHVHVLKINLSRTTNGWEYVEKFIPKPQSLPLYMTFAEPGKPAALSQPAGKDNIGMPTDSEEVARLVTMIRGVAPKMTDGQASELSRVLLAGGK